MPKLLRRLLVRHDWSRAEGVCRICSVCDRTEERDIEVEIPGPNPWFCVSRVIVDKHFASPPSISQDGHIRCLRHNQATR